MGLTLSDLLLAWLGAAGVARETLDGAIDKAKEKFPDLEGPAEEVRAEIAAGLEASGLDPAAALALAVKALGELKTGTAGRNPNAFGVGG